MAPPLDLKALPSLYRDHVSALGRAYATVMQAHALDAVVLHAGTPQAKSVFDDQYWPLVTVPHTKHWLPLNLADSALVVRPGKTPQLLLNTERGFWDGALPLEQDFFLGAFDVVECKDAAAVGHALPPAGARRAFIGENRARAAEWGFAEATIAPTALLRALDALRVHKTPYEVLCLREANRRAAVGHAAVLQAFHSGAHSELELHLLYLRATEQDDPETPYKNIVALGEHAATLHHVHYGRAKVQAQSLLLDAGASFCGYDSDITRTAVKGTGAAADTFRGLLAGMEKLQQELCARAVPGIPYEQLHNQCHELLAEVLRNTKIARASADELVSSGLTRVFLPHGLGHSLGLQTHDVGCRNTLPEPRNPFLRNTAPVAAGQVFTIEPGCYFIDLLLKEARTQPHAAAIDWQLVDALTPFGGVRIEDDLVVQAGAPENMTRAYL